MNGTSIIMGSHGFITITFQGLSQTESTQLAVGLLDAITPFVRQHKATVNFLVSTKPPQKEEHQNEDGKETDQ